MNRWQALVSIVQAFLDGGRPGFAFAAIVVITGWTLALALIATLVLRSS